MKTFFIVLLLSASSFSFAETEAQANARMGVLSSDKMTHGVICSDEEGKDGNSKKKSKTKSATAVDNG